MSGYVWKKSGIPADTDYFDSANTLKGWVRDLGAGKFSSNIETGRDIPDRFITGVFGTLDEAKAHVEFFVELES